MISNKKKTFGNVREEVFENVLEIFEKLSDKPSEIFKTFSEGFKMFVGKLDVYFCRFRLAIYIVSDSLLRRSTNCRLGVNKES